MERGREGSREGWVQGGTISECEKNMCCVCVCVCVCAHVCMILYSYTFDDISFVRKESIPNDQIPASHEKVH